MARYRLDLEKRSDAVLLFEEKLKSKVIGQDEAINELVLIYQSYLAGMKQVDRPIANLLFLGPTGVGKTLLVEAVAEVLCGYRWAFLKINCAEYRSDHEVARLIGAPPGYTGYADPPVFAQGNIDKYKTAEHNFSLILFDEIEKANPALSKLMLSILDKGNLGLGTGATADFTSSFIFMTSNLGSAEIIQLHDGLGFSPKVDTTKGRIESITNRATNKHFSPEFINRLDKIIVFNSLTQDHMKKILDVETGMIQTRVLLSPTKFVIRYSDAAKAQLLAEGYNPKFGARHLKRNLERNVVLPLTSFMASKQVGFGDVVDIDYKDGEFAFEVSVGQVTDILSKSFTEPAKEVSDKKKEETKTVFSQCPGCV